MNTQPLVDTINKLPLNDDQKNLCLNQLKQDHSEKSIKKVIKYLLVIAENIRSQAKWIEVTDYSHKLTPESVQTHRQNKDETPKQKPHTTSLPPTS